MASSEFVCFAKDKAEKVFYELQNYEVVMELFYEGNLIYAGAVKRNSTIYNERDKTIRFSTVDVLTTRLDIIRSDDPQINYQIFNAIKILRDKGFYGGDENFLKILFMSGDAPLFHPLRGLPSDRLRWLDQNVNLWKRKLDGETDIDQYLYNARDLLIDLLKYYNEMLWVETVAWSYNDQIVPVAKVKLQKRNKNPYLGDVLIWFNDYIELKRTYVRPWKPKYVILNSARRVRRTSTGFEIISDHMVMIDLWNKKVAKIGTDEDFTQLTAYLDKDLVIDLRPRTNRFEDPNGVVTPIERSYQLTLDGTPFNPTYDFHCWGKLSDDEYAEMVANALIDLVPETFTYEVQVPGIYLISPLDFVYVVDAGHLKVMRVVYDFENMLTIIEGTDARLNNIGVTL